LTFDLVARTTSILWCTAWVHTFGEIGDTANTQELVAGLAEKKVHCEAVQGGLNRLVSERVKVADTDPPNVRAYRLISGRD
jgi:hypothetical protein